MCSNSSLGPCMKSGLNGHVGCSFTFFNKADLSENARIEPGPLGWHASTLTTELHEVKNSEVPQPIALLVALDQNTDPQVPGSKN